MNNSKELAKVPAKPTNGTPPPTPQKSEKPAQDTTLKTVPLTEKKTESLEDRLHRLNLLFDLQKKFNRLQESKQKLDSFEINQNRENSTLEIRDDEGNEFETSNPVVITEVVKLIKKVIAEKSASIADQIKF